VSGESKALVQGSKFKVQSFSCSIIFSLKKLAGPDELTFSGKFVIVFKSCEIFEKFLLR
jgi:hypothetical protein